MKISFFNFARNGVGGTQKPNPEVKDTLNCMSGSHRGGHSRRGGKSRGSSGFKLQKVGKYLAIDQFNVVHVRAAKSPPTSQQCTEAAHELREQLQASFNPDVPVSQRLQVVVELGGSPRARGSLDAAGVKALVDVFIEYRDIV